ncbi:MAG: diacylglycerol kinase [Pseudohongiellaceae bacterium]|nr:diacylglycerol kinase [Pseudohongiellaceae bacterium]
MSTKAKASESASVPVKKKGVARLIAATGYSIAGLRSAFSSEEAFRLEVFALIIALPLAFYFGQTPVEQILLIGSIILVMIVELLNTSVEAVVDRVGVEFHPLAREAKDIGSAAVFVAMAFAGFTWLMLLL